MTAQRGDFQRPSSPTDSDRAMAAVFVRQVWWAGAVKAPTGPATDDLAQMFAAARDDALAPVRAVIEGAQEEIDADRESDYAMGMAEVVARLRAAIGDDDRSER